MPATSVAATQRSLKSDKRVKKLVSIKTRVEQAFKACINDGRNCRLPAPEVLRVGQKEVPQRLKP